jgi:hypothetical protein
VYPQQAKKASQGWVRKALRSFSLIRMLNASVRLPFFLSSSGELLPSLEVGASDDRFGAAGHTPSVFGRNLQCQPVRRVNIREECHWSHACKSFKRTCVGSNGIIVRKFLPKTRTVPFTNPLMMAMLSPMNCGALRVSCGIHNTPGYFGAPAFSGGARQNNADARRMWRNSRCKANVTESTLEDECGGIHGARRMSTTN